MPHSKSGQGCSWAVFSRRRQFNLSKVEVWVLKSVLPKKKKRRRRLGFEDIYPNSVP
jgi:hypothetical protein